MILISIVQNPPASAKEMVKRSMEMPRLPEFIKTIGPYINSFTGEGVKTLTIYEFEDSRYVEGRNHIFKMLGTFYGVPGFTFSLQLWAKAKDAFQATGLL